MKLVAIDAATGKSLREIEIGPVFCGPALSRGIFPLHNIGIVRCFGLPQQVRRHSYLLAPTGRGTKGHGKRRTIAALGLLSMRTQPSSEQLDVEDFTALAPDIFAAVKVRCPADTMFGNEIPTGGMKALTKFHFQEGIEAAVALARTQGGHGSESRTGEIMKILIGYGKAAQPAIPQLRELIAELNEQVKRKEFPGYLNKRRVADMEAAIAAIEAATTQPELRTFSRK